MFLPSLKSGKKQEPGNYLQVSMTSLIAQSAYEHVETNAMVTEIQHRFLKNNPFQSNLIYFKK